MSFGARKYLQHTEMRAHILTHKHIYVHIHTYTVYYTQLYRSNKEQVGKLLIRTKCLTKVKRSTRVKMYEQAEHFYY